MASVLARGTRASWSRALAPHMKHASSLPIALFSFSFYCVLVLACITPTNGQSPWETSDKLAGLHITHVFSTFAPQTEDGRREAHIIQQSWAEAAQFAEDKLPGTKIEWINLVLPQDEPSASKLLRPHKTILLKKPVQNIAGNSVPAVGEILAKADALASSPWIVYTNADIGLANDFYFRLASLIGEHHFPTLEATRFGLQDAAKMFRDCLYSMQASHSCELAQALCFADAAEWWANVGAGSREAGAKDLFSTYLGAAFEKRVGKCELTGLTSINPAATPHQVESALYEYRRETQRFLPLAGTITRVNLPEQAVNLALRGLYTNAGLQVPIWQRLQRQLELAGESHPGNDCFFFQKGRLPRPIRKLWHPMGMRPWGMWLPWQFQHDEAGAQVWRRISGTSRDLWTFHLGVSADSWRDQARSDDGGAFILGLAANWYNATQHRYASAFQEIPWYCNAAQRWRDNSFCAKNPPSYCRGRVHLACDPFEHLKLRATQSYLRQCKLQINTGGDGSLSSLPASPASLQAFCNMLLRLTKSTKLEMVSMKTASNSTRAHLDDKGIEADQSLSSSSSLSLFRQRLISTIGND